MKTKDKVFEILLDNIGKSVSGEEIAKKLGLSRNSIWSAVTSLKKDGYKITSATNTGYMLSNDNDIFTSQSIQKYLEAEHKIILFDEVTSTNLVAKEIAPHEKEGTVVIAKRQLNGRGRMGRTFSSNSENGLYMSIILKPHSAIESTNITVLCATAVYEAILEVCGKESHIKWVNDIFLNNKKICGILTEGAIDMETSTLDYAVCGIGINLSLPKGGFDETLKDIAGSIYEKEIPCGYKAKLCAAIINKFFKYYNRINEKEYMKTYREKSNIIGEEVSVIFGKEIIEGTAIDIDENAKLVVKTKDGDIFRFSSGEARVRKNGK